MIKDNSVEELFPILFMFVAIALVILGFALNDYWNDVMTLLGSYVVADRIFRNLIDVKRGQAVVPLLEKMNV